MQYKGKENPIMTNETNTTAAPPLDYSRLSPENQNRVDKYIKNLFRLQKAQAAVSATDLALSAADNKLNKELRTLNLSPETTDIRGSFCGKHSDLCRKVIAGPKEVYICDECVDLCHEILEEEIREDGKN